MIRGVEMDADEAARWERFGRALADALPKSPLRTQKGLAAYLQVDQTLISAWTRGTKLRRMTPGRAAKIERGLGPEACPPGSLASILFGPGIAAVPASLEDRLAAIETQLVEQRAAIAAQGAMMTEILQAVKEADRRLDDRGTS